MNIRCFSCMNEFDAEYGICPICGHDIDSDVDERALRPSTWLNNGRYYIGKVLGIGGFAITYVAWDDELGTKVAIKEFFPSDWATRDPVTQNVEHGSGYDDRENFFGAKEAFINESRTLASVGSLPGIVSVYGRFEEHDTAYIVMEFVPGEDLGDILKRDGTYTYSDAIKILLPVMRSLARVHGKGIVHKDISPDNIMFFGGRVKLIDFGASANAFTETEGIALKPGYAPPEQYEDGCIPSPAIDVYAMGAVLYHMITGVLPTESTKRVEAVNDGREDPLAAPDTCQLTKEQLPEGLFDIIKQAMELDEGRRTGNIITLADQLEKYVKKEESVIVDEGPDKKKIRKIMIPIIAVFLVVIAAVTVNFVWLHKSFNEEETVAVNMRTMPDLVGLSKDEAEAKITDRFYDLELIVSEEKEKTSDKSLDGKVAVQDPAAGEFDRNKYTKVTVVLYDYEAGAGTDQANKKVKIPDVTGKTKDAAKKALKKAGLLTKNISTNEEYSSSVASGKVISQSIAAGKVVNGEKKITLTISKGPQPVTTTRYYSTKSSSSYGSSSSSSGSSSRSSSSSQERNTVPPAALDE